MFFNITVHDFFVESKWLLCGKLIRQFTVLWLNNVDFFCANHVCYSILTLVCNVVRLLIQETLLCECAIDLVYETTRGTRVFGRLFVEFSHFVVELVDFAFIDYGGCLFKRATFLRGRGAWRIVSILTGASLLFELLDLRLNICYLLLKPFILE